MWALHPAASLQSQPGVLSETIRWFDKWMVQLVNLFHPVWSLWSLAFTHRVYHRSSCNDSSCTCRNVQLHRVPGWSSRCNTFSCPCMLCIYSPSMNTGYQSQRFCGTQADTCRTSLRSITHSCCYNCNSRLRPSRGCNPCTLCTCAICRIQADQNPSCN